MNKLLFLDLETTGLNPSGGLILEVAAVVVDEKMNQLDSYSSVISWPKEVLFQHKMDNFVLNMHFNSGLFKEVITLGKAEDSVKEDLIKFIKKNFGKEKPILAGNSIHFDRRFLIYHMPEVEELLHYRMVDVSGINEAFRLKGCDIPRSEIVVHRAMPDVQQSIKFLINLLSLVN